MDTELNILNTKFGGTTLKEMSAITFLQYVAKKLNDVKAYTATSNELRLLISNAPMSRFMSDDEKLKVIEKLKKLNIELP